MADPNFRYEWVSAVFTFADVTDTTFSSIDVYVINRGGTEESFQVVIHGRYSKSDGTTEEESFSGSVLSVDPGRVTGWGIVDEAFGVEVYESVWLRIYTTSANLVPSLYYGLEHPTGPETDVRYFAPGDFKVFEIREHNHLPIPPVGPISEA